MAADAQTIADTFKSREVELPMFSNKQWAYLTDYNSGSYTSQIMFDLQNLKTQYINLRDGYLAIPLTLTGTGYSAPTYMAVKCSLLSLIYGLVVTQPSGGTIINELGINFINNIRLLIECGFDYINQDGPELQFAKDTFPNSIAVLSSPEPDETQFAVTSGDVTGWNANFNASFLQRVTVFNQMSTLSGSNPTVYNLTAILPLRLLHDFFEQLDMILINSRFQINFIIAWGASCPYPPIQISSVSTPTKPTVTVGGGIGNCRIYYPKINLSPMDNAEYARKLAAGFKKTIKFITTDFYPLVTDNNTSQISQIVSQSTINPLRLWVLLFPTGAITASNGQSCSPYVCTGQLTNCNVMINGVNYYENSFLNTWELWQELREQMPYASGSDTNGGMLNYADFLTYYRYHVFDLSRVKDRLRNPNDPCAIMFNANRAESGTIPSVDFLYLIEREVQVTLHMSSSDLQVLVGPNS